jgi:LAS superfamily LD-carboxypeptidase LdcB
MARRDYILLYERLFELLKDVPPPSTGGSTPTTSTETPLEGIDPAPLINPDKIGSDYYNTSFLAKDFAKTYQNGKIPLNAMTKIQEGAVKTYYPDGFFRLHPKAAIAWFKWRDEMDNKKIFYRVTSAYRSTSHQAGLGSGKTVAKPGSSPHGWGGALDFGNLYALVGGSGDPIKNKNKRISIAIYKQIAEIGAKYGWYNPWRLSDSSGTVDEMWHFEYWGPI